jgi:acyl carrier protein
MTSNDLSIASSLGGEIRLIGHEAVLDSMGLVNLIVELEQRLEEEYDMIVVLADERAMSQKNSPFRSVQTLADYIYKVAEEQN